MAAPSCNSTSTSCCSGEPSHPFPPTPPPPPPCVLDFVNLLQMLFNCAAFLNIHVGKSALGLAMCSILYWIVPRSLESQPVIQLLASAAPASPWQLQDLLYIVKLAMHFVQLRPRTPPPPPHGGAALKQVRPSTTHLHAACRSTWLELT